MDTVSLIQDAEAKLIEPLFRFCPLCLKDIQSQRYLATYPYTEGPGKIQVIRQIIRTLKPLRESAPLLKLFEKFEAFMWAIGKRDHFIHQFEVFLLGWYIFSALTEKTGSDRIEISGLGPIDSEVFFEYWLLTAMGHDLGYPLQESPNIISELRKLHQDGRLRGVANLYLAFWKTLTCRNQQNHLPWVENLLNKQGKKINQHIIMGLQFSLKISPEAARKIGMDLAEANNNHGYLSALLIGNALYPTFARRGLDSSNTSVHLYRLLLAAIALHHIKGEQQKEKDIIREIDFSTNPFAYLLYVADNLQEWSRPPGASPEGAAPETLLTSCHAIGGQIGLVFVTRHDSWGAQLSRQVLKEVNAASRRLKIPRGPRSGVKLKVMYSFNNINMEPKILSLAI
jgi:hypothetical protein